MSPRPDLGPKPQLGYTASLLDRAAHRRGEAAALAADPRVGAYVVGGELVIARKRDSGGDPLFVGGGSRDELVLIGEAGAAAAGPVGRADVLGSGLRAGADEHAIAELRFRRDGWGLL